MAVTPDKQLYILQVATTAKCNMACSFCKGAVYMEQKDQPKMRQFDQVEGIVKANPQLTDYVWGGGEPLLAINKLKEMVAMCQKETPHAQHQLLTNGRKLKLEQLDFLKGFGMISVSIDGFELGERTLKGFVEDNDYEAFETIYKLDNVQTWAVVTAEQLWEPRWHEDIIKMHNSYHHLGFQSVGLILDKNMVKPLFTDQVLNFVYGWKRIRENLEQLNARYGTETRMNFPSFFGHYNCTNCSTAAMLEPDGTLSRPEDPEEIVEAGCNKMAEVFGVDAYNYLIKFLFPKRDEDDK